MAKIDLDKNGTVDFEEFVIMMHQRLGSGIPEQEIWESFTKFDRNGDGKNLGNFWDTLFLSPHI